MTFNEMLYDSKSRLVQMFRLLALLPLILAFDATILVANCMYSAAEWWLNTTGSYGRYSLSIAWDVYQLKVRRKALSPSGEGEGGEGE